MNHKDIRKGVTQAEFNEDSSTILLGEIVIISILAGAFTHSWWGFGICLFGLLACMFFKKTAFYLAIILSLCWAGVGVYIGLDWFKNTGAAVVLAIIGLVAGLGVHFSALEYIEDLNEQ